MMWWPRRKPTPICGEAANGSTCGRPAAGVAELVDDGKTLLQIPVCRTHARWLQRREGWKVRQPRRGELRALAELGKGGV